MDAHKIDAQKWFLVSGGSGGIGAAVCDSLAAHGYTPLVGYHRNAAAAQVVAQRCGGQALALDLSSDASIQAAVAQLETLPELAGVVLAGSPPLSLLPFGKISADEMQQQWQVNVLGPQRLLAELVRRCFRKHKKGAVVGVLTQAMGNGTNGIEGASSGMGAYVIAKHGMAGMLAMLAADYAWLRVRAVKPGYTETPMLDAFDERFLATQREKAPFQTPAQVASLIVEEAIGA
ncbi:SDR family NAD(P)-dependent oxidoreductase [Rhodoferax sp. WC2427]|uniref:SDR family NAD(P)-dependent oxidoreductase n=1 Tax=Rhodoferax sp. WC2427 TaxID=3234144 RepID=UPI00346509B5